MASRLLKITNVEFDWLLTECSEGIQCILCLLIVAETRRALSAPQFSCLCNMCYGITCPMSEIRFEI